RKTEPDTATIKAFVKAGATYGRAVVRAGYTTAFSTPEEARGEGTPAFRFSTCDDTTLRSLPGADVPFGLVLRGTAVTDEGLRALAAFKHLQLLDVGKTKVGDGGVRHLAALAQLESLSLWDTRVGDEGLKHLGALKQLVSLDVGATLVTDQGLKHLAGL